MPFVGLNLVSAYLDLEMYDEAEQLCDGNDRHRQGEYEGRLQYAGAVSDWFLAKDGEALKRLASVARRFDPRCERLERPLEEP
ncbi:MAG: hypothetical protein R3E96_01235 [Planctomycetota bacterium]